MQGIDIAFNYVGARQNIALLQLKGFLDTTTSTEVSNRLRNLLNDGVYHLVVDMSRVNYVSSAGWGVFVGEIRNIRENGGDLKVVQMTPEVYDVFEMLEFHRILDYYDTIEESLNDFDISMGNNITQGKQWSKNTPTKKVDEIEIALPREIATKDGAKERRARSRFKFTKPKVDEAMLPLVEKIKLIVIEDPDGGVWQVRKKLNVKRFGFEKVSIFKIYDILKKYSLDTKEKRYRFYRSR
ncbi:MAG: STAS domain-containing protein [Calditrichaeota bacterium]|nr:STAS domain-containing protein [Calditrichota bacterium]